MKEIISDQKIRVDNHNRAQEVKYKGLHIHKTVFRKNFSVDIIVPFEPSQSVQVRANNLNDKDRNVEFNRVVKEINRAFAKNKDKRKQFILDIIDAVEKFSDNSSKIDNLKTAANTIANHFDLKKDFTEEITTAINDKIKSYATIHQPKSGANLFYIYQSENFLEVGELVERSALYNLINKK